MILEKINCSGNLLIVAYLFINEHGCMFYESWVLALNYMRNARQPFVWKVKILKRITRIGYRMLEDLMKLYTDIIECFKCQVQTFSYLAIILCRRYVNDSSKEILFTSWIEEILSLLRHSKFYSFFLIEIIGF